MKYLSSYDEFNKNMCELFGVEYVYMEEDEVNFSEECLEPWNKGVKTGPITQEHKDKISKGVRNTMLDLWKNPEFRKQRCEAMNLAWKSPELREKRKKQKCKYLYEITTPIGEKIIIDNLTEYCRNNNLSEENLRKVINGKRNHHKNHTVKILSKIER